MHVAAPHQAHVQGDSGGRGERRDGMLGQLRVERRVAERQALGHGHVPHHEGAAREVEGDVDERFVEWVTPRGETAHTHLRPHRFAEGLAERDGHIFHGVVRVDVQVAGGSDGEIEPTVLAHLFEHVVVERDTGGGRGIATAVEVDAELDGGFLGGAPVCGPTAR